MKKTLTATFDSRTRHYSQDGAFKARSTAQSYINWLDKHCGKRPRRLEVVEVRVT